MIEHASSSKLPSARKVVIAFNYMYGFNDLTTITNCIIYEFRDLGDGR